MKPVLIKTVLSLALCAAPFAQAQNCGSGGGATVCLTASGTGSDATRAASSSASRFMPPPRYNFARAGRPH